MFDKWIDTFIEEKGIDTEHTFDVEGPIWGWNHIPLGCIIEQLKVESDRTQEMAMVSLIKLDFLNMDIMAYFEKLAKGMAR